MLNCDSDIVKRYVCMALCNLTTKKLNQEHIIKLGGLPYLIDLASNIHTKDCRYIVICNLYWYNCTFIVDSGGLKPFITWMISSDRLEIQRAAALAIYNLSCAAANQIAIANSGVHENLVRLCSSNDVDTKRYCIMILCNLATESETRLLSTHIIGLQAAIELYKDNCRRYAFICLCNMANHPTPQVQIIVHGGLPAILNLANGSDIYCQLY